MNRDLFLSILAIDSYNRGYANGVTVPGLNSKLGTADIGVDSSILRDENSSRKDIPAGFFAQSYIWNGKTIISYRGTDGLDDVYKGWTTGLGWTDQDQAGLALEFYEAATGLDPFAYALPTDIVLTGHSLGGGLAGFVSVLSGAEAVMFDHMPYGRAAIDTYLGALADLGEAIDQFTSSGEDLVDDIGAFMSGKRFVTRALLESLADIVTLVQSGSDYVDAVKAVANGDYGRGPNLRGLQASDGLQSAYNTDSHWAVIAAVNNNLEWSEAA